MPHGFKSILPKETSEEYDWIINGSSGMMVFAPVKVRECYSKLVCQPGGKYPKGLAYFRAYEFTDMWTPERAEESPAADPEMVTKPHEVNVNADAGAWVKDKWSEDGMIDVLLNTETYVLALLTLECKDGRVEERYTPLEYFKGHELARACSELCPHTYELMRITEKEVCRRGRIELPVIIPASCLS